MKQRSPFLRSASRALATLFLGLASVACGSTSQLLAFPDEGLRVRSTTDEDGSTVEWRLFSSERSSPRLDRTHKFVEEVPRIGARVALVTRQRAEELRCEPWKGVVVESVEGRSAAASAGLVNGDVILSVGGEPVASPEQYADAIKQKGTIGEPLDFELFVHRRTDGAVAEASSAIVRIAPAAHELKRVKTDSYPLATSKGVLAYAGMQLAEIPASLANDAYGEDRTLVVVAGVESGSPAYDAGLRAGDVFQECNGEAVRSIVDVRRATLALLERGDFRGPLYDLSELQSDEGALPAESGTMQLRVRGPIGPHTADLGVDPDYDEETGFGFPILLRYSLDADEADVGFLNFIFQFGFNYESRLRPSSTRAPVKTWRLTMLPFNLIKVERNLHDTEYRLLWFIHW